jgi:hypothetical protein
VALGTDTTGNYVGDVTAGLGLVVTGASAENATKTVALDTAAALTGDHTLNANEWRPGQNGIIFEGSSADTIETYFSVTNPTSSDKTITVPDLSGTLILSGYTFTGDVTGTLSASGTNALTLGTGLTLTTPRFADLGYIADSSGNEMLIFDSVASAVNNFQISNAATTSGPTLSAVGNDTNIAIAISPKGTGHIHLNASATTPATLRFYEQNTSGTDYLALTGGTSITATATIQLPDPGAAGTYTLTTTEDVDGTNTGTHATPSTTTPLSPTWNGPTHVVYYNTTGTINLPAAAGYANRTILIYNTGSNTITVDSNGSEVIVRNGTAQTGGVSITLSSGAGNYVVLISDGTRWITLGYIGTLAQGS